MISRETEWKMAKREADRKGGEEDGDKALLGLTSEPTKVEEEYDWDELRPLPLDGQGKVVCMTDDKGSGEGLHLRRRGRGRGRKKRLRKARMEKWKGVELKRSTSMAVCKGNIREEPRDSVGAQGEQVAQVMAARRRGEASLLMWRLGG